VVSRRADDEETELDATATLGSVLVFAGRMDEGWDLMAETVCRAAEGAREATAARAYRMLGSSASVLVDYDRAEYWLGPGIEYAGAADLWNHRNYLLGHAAHVQWATGDWAAADSTARRTLADGRGGVTTTITALYVLGYLAMGRGDWDSAEPLLAEARERGEAMRELQRISPPLWGEAEAAILRGDHGRAAALCERGRRLSAAVDDAAYLFPFLVTGVRSLLANGDEEGAARWVADVGSTLQRRGIPGTLPAIQHGRGLVLQAAGDHEAAREALAAAAAAWTARRRFWEGSWAALDAARAALALRRLTDVSAAAGTVRSAAISAGAETLVVAADALIDAPRRGRPAQPWDPLTEREYTVARLVMDGLTNREIAAELYLSPKTVSAHVEHILTKLGVGRRAEIAAWAARVHEH
jgi:DNA-binding CsgD family transcriptional regulator/tetratricopeptide (TPR) repeat protein